MQFRIDISPIFALPDDKRAQRIGRLLVGQQRLGLCLFFHKARISGICRIDPTSTARTSQRARHEFGMGHAVLSWGVGRTRYRQRGVLPHPVPPGRLGASSGGGLVGPVRAAANPLTLATCNMQHATVHIRHRPTILLLVACCLLPLLGTEFPAR